MITPGDPATDGFHTRIADGVAHLQAADPVLCEIIGIEGECRLAPSRGHSPYEGLVRSVAYQQIQGKAADAILARFIALFASAPFPSPTELLATDATTLRGAGFSASKVAAIHGIAAQTAAGAVPDRIAAETIDDAELISRLTTIRGVGPWTVEMMLIFTLGRLDVLPLTDFGVRSGIRAAYRLDQFPDKRSMAGMGEAWRPYRSIASWYLWRTAERHGRAAAAAAKRSG